MENWLNVDFVTVFLRWYDNFIFYKIKNNWLIRYQVIYSFIWEVEYFQNVIFEASDCSMMKENQTNNN